MTDPITDLLLRRRASFVATKTIQLQHNADLFARTGDARYARNVANIQAQVASAASSPFYNEVPSSYAGPDAAENTPAGGSGLLVAAGLALLLSRRLF